MLSSNLAPEQYLQEAYLGEIGGEATFRALARALPERKKELVLLAEVERVTAEYLRQHLLSTVPEERVRSRRAEGVERVNALGIESWSALLDSAIPVVDAALELMRAAEAQAPEELLQVYQTFTAHEQALADYMRLEQQGKEGGHILEGFIRRIGQ